jgi:DNA-binding ferritin-like protein
MNLAAFAALLRSLQLFAHNAHHLACGVSFFADHEFLGEAYAAYEEAYDDVIELMIGNGAMPTASDLVAIQQQALELLGALSLMPDRDPFAVLLRGESQLQGAVDQLCAGSTDQGDIQVLGSLAQESKVRAYKLGRRVLAC